jgi:uncharacterized protein YheU (UPF0270 family)
LYITQNIQLVIYSHDLPPLQGQDLNIPELPTYYNWQKEMEVIITWQDIDSETLSELLKEIVSRDGTDYGADEMSTGEKIEQALHSLRSKTAVLCWDTELESANLRPRDDIDAVQHERWHKE